LVHEKMVGSFLRVEIFYNFSLKKSPEIKL
jgi:hypothetical protein